MNLSTAEKIRILLKRKNHTIKDLSTILSVSPQNLSNKLSRDNFTEKDLHEIANALDCTYESYFITHDGEKI